VEAALAEHPDVDEAAAFGVPHPTLGEMLVAAVVLRPGAGVGPLDLRLALRGRLAPFKVPSRIEVVDALPRNAMGKVEKRRLRASYAL
jgi:acyl-CoA synthetase (AMP-forming)/AMP-acid ligase II